jgi:hypothetical protein
VRLSWSAASVSGSPIADAQVAVFNTNGGKPSGVRALVRLRAADASYTFTGLTAWRAHRLS